MFGTILFQPLKEANLSTFPETNIAENGWLEDEFPIGMP